MAEIHGSEALGRNRSFDSGTSSKRRATRCLSMPNKPGVISQNLEGAEHTHLVPGICKAAGDTIGLLHTSDVQLLRFEVQIHLYSK